MTKQELLEENDHLIETLRGIRNEIDEVLDESDEEAEEDSE